MIQATQSDLFVLQELVYPEPGISTEAALYFRIEGEGGQRATEAGFWLGAGATLRLDSYFNAFDAGEWASACGLETLAFQLEGEGRVCVRVVQSDPHDRLLSHRVMSTVVVETEAWLGADDRFEVNLAAYLPEGVPRVLHVEIEAGAAGARIEAGRFVTHDRPAAMPRLAISITTFRREAAVEATARRIDAFLIQFEHRDHVWLQVVDNGQSAKIAPSSHVQVFPNRNLGGAGGFARGLIEARAAAATHCLFMDDDASFHVENIRRTYALLALARDPKTALAGAMITNTRRYEMFENGAVFDGICRPRHMHTDLRDRSETFQMMFKATAALPDNSYGGWWYFAFPLAQARHLPFPFFVRGDDSGFSLANRFHIRTLNGVVSFQDAFGEKESPLVHYLDARYHLLHHIVFAELDRGRRGNALVPLRLILRSIVKFHYEAAEAQIMAVRDVIRGPDFFLENADMATRRHDLKALTRNEVWRDTQARPTPLRGNSLIGDRLWAITLNGHLLPFFGRFGAQRVIRLSMRGPIWPVWGAREITYVNRATRKGYTVALDRKRGLRLLWLALRDARALYRVHSALVAEYRNRYGELTSEATWKSLLGLDAPQ